MRTLAVIPARYGSTRLPGKPLADICGKPMIQYVYAAAERAEALDEVVVATDDARVVRAVEHFGGKARLTSRLCESGTDRLVELSKTLHADVYLNVQGDEPLLDPEVLNILVRKMEERPDIQALTPVYRVSARDAENPNLVKAVLSAKGEALYFSRSLVPCDRDGVGAVVYYGHMGVYAYRQRALDVFHEAEPGPLERAEKLEQLRLLENDVRIHVVEVDPPRAQGVDTPEDLERVCRVLEGKESASPMADQEKAAGVSVKKLRDIRLVLTDVDGVLTDGGLYYGADGETVKRFCSQDGLGIVLLREAGIDIGVVSGRDCPALRARLEDLKIRHFRLGSNDKRTACEELFKEVGTSHEETLFMGDDLPDIQGFEACSLGVAPANARQEVKQAASLVLSSSGGHGALRELVDMLLAERMKLRV